MPNKEGLRLRARAIGSRGSATTEALAGLSTREGDEVVVEGEVDARHVRERRVGLPCREDRGQGARRAARPRGDVPAARRRRARARARATRAGQEARRAAPGRERHRNRARAPSRASRRPGSGAIHGSARLRQADRRRVRHENAQGAGRAPREAVGVAGLGRKRAESIAAAWKRAARAPRRHGLPAGARRVARARDSHLQALRAAAPHVVSRGTRTGSPSTCGASASRRPIASRAALGIAQDSPQRIQAGILQSSTT